MLPRTNNQLNAKLKVQSQHHFQNLLGIKPSVPEQPIEQIIDKELDIKTGNILIQKLCCLEDM
jgi:hypothetical protein